MPDAFELPGMLRAVVPLVGRERLTGLRTRIVDELVALTFRRAVWSRRRLAGRCPRLVPGFAAVIGALDDLPEPAAGLRCVDAVGSKRRTLHVIDLPPGKVGAADVPPLAFAVRCQNERALARANQYSYTAHPFLLLEFREMLAGSISPNCSQ